MVMKTSTPSNLPQSNRFDPFKIQSNANKANQVFGAFIDKPNQSMEDPDVLAQFGQNQSMERPENLPEQPKAPAAGASSSEPPQVGEKPAEAVQPPAEEMATSTAPAVAESTATIEPDGSTTTSTKDYTTPEAQEYKKQMDDSMQSIDAEIEYARSRFKSIAEGADAAQANLSTAIDKTFEVRKYEMERINKAALNTQTLLGSRSGRQRYAPEMQGSILSEEERAGLVRFTEIEALEFQTIALAQKAATDEDLAILNQQMTTLGDLRAEKQGIMTNIYNSAVLEEKRAQTRAKFAVDYDKITTELEQSKFAFKKNIQEYEADYLAQNLVRITPEGDIEQIPEIEIVAMATEMGLDPMVVKAKVNQFGRELRTYEAGMRSGVLNEMMTQTQIDANQFALEKSSAFFPYELENLQLQNFMIQSEIESIGADMGVDDGLVSAAKQIQKGEAKLTDFEGEDRTKINSILEKLPPTKAQVRSVEEKISMVDKILEHPGLNSAVGSNIGGRIPLGDFVTGQRDDFISLVDQILSVETLNTLANAKKEGATFGALSDAELRLLQEAAAAIDKGWTGYDVTESHFKEQMTNLRDGLQSTLDEQLEQARRTYEGWAMYPDPEEAKKLQDALIKIGKDPSDPTDSYDGWQMMFGGGVLTNESQTSLKGSDVTGIKDMSKVQTNIGKGTATGIESGSSAWKYGFDFVLEGGKGAKVPAPFSGTVVKTGYSETPGNQVRIRLDDGREVWISHLDSMNVRPGQRINAGQIIGTQGNTGLVLSNQGQKLSQAARKKGSGTHLDITIKKPDGGYLSSQEVASLLNTQLS